MKDQLCALEPVFRREDDPDGGKRQKAVWAAGKRGIYKGGILGKVIIHTSSVH